jgi:hypothetical protein
MRRGLLAAVACALVLASSAHAAVIPGSPLTIYAVDNGRLQVAFSGGAVGEFSPPSLAPANAGVNLAVTGTGANPGPFTVFGFLGSAFTQAAAPVLTGDGSAGNPWRLQTTYQADTPNQNRRMLLGEQITYVNGTTDINVLYTVLNFADGPTIVLNARLYAAANLSVAGDETGTGFLDPGPPRAVGANNQLAGGSARLVEQTTPWAHFQESRPGDLFAAIANTDPAAQGFNDTIAPSLVDDAAGAQWDFPTLANGAAGAQTVALIWRFKHFAPLQLAAVASTRATGQLANVTVTAQRDGNPDPSRAVRYAITGANPSTGAVTTGADGKATITWAGTKVGTDTLTAFVDANANRVRDADEPQQAVTVTWTPPPPPVPGKSVVASVVSGTVFVKYPPGYVPRAVTPAKGFVPFKGAANLPVGTQFDTKHGRLKLTSAADTDGKKTQASDFYAGIFQVKQAVPKKTPKKPVALTTDIVLKGQIARSECAPLKGAQAAAVSAKKKKRGAKSVLGKLWGNGKGKFRTTGKYSSATVRGTIWLTQDRCDGTLTSVRRGSVRVFDRKRKKTVTVKAPHSYLARAQRAASKRHR